nr:CBS domain-containing protein [Beggiatoa alba]
MIANLISIDGSTVVEEAMHLMRKHHISSLIVNPDADGKWGIMTQKDVLTKIIHANRSPASVKVAEVTTKPLQMVPVDTSLHDCVSIMTDNNIRRVVVEKDGAPIGIVSDTDVFRTVEEFGWIPE